MFLLFLIFGLGLGTLSDVPVPEELRYYGAVSHSGHAVCDNNDEVSGFDK